MRLAADAGDWDQGARVLAEASGVLPCLARGPGAGALVGPDGPAELESVLAAFPAECRAGAAPVAAALAAARLWQGDAGGRAPHLDCARALAGTAGRRGARRRRAVADGPAGHAGRRDPAGRAGCPVAGRAEQASEAAATACRSTGRRGCCGSRSAARGCAAWRPARPGCLRPGQRAAPAGACPGCGPAPWPGRRWPPPAGQPGRGQRHAGRDRPPTRPRAPGRTARIRLWTARVALASAQVSLYRDELDGARALLDEADRCARPGRSPASRRPPRSAG